MVRAVFILAACGLALGCSAAPRGLAWTIDFETPALHTQTSVVSARILRGSCTGTVVYQTEVRASGTMTMSPPNLAPGTYAFAATAYDATCAQLGDDCISITLPGAATVMNLIRAHAAAAACPAAMCRMGSCAVDAGTPDSGPRDAGPLDAPPQDAPGRDAGRDAVVCALTETSCTNHIDDDCNGLSDCADPACTHDTACAACTGVACGACQMCDPATGHCITATDGSACATGHCLGGVCCGGCVSGGMCSPGSTPTTCGANGNACTACAECQTCTGGTCVAGMAGASCSGGTGRCAAGACCPGCIDATSACRIGGATTACGRGGATCAACGVCQTCNGVSCVSAMDGAACPTGACLNGSCCDGCFIVGTCQPGNAQLACGPRGGSCVSCGECQMCSAAGACVPASDGTACAGGTCSTGMCCTGCTQGGVCQPGDVRFACGYGGHACGRCPTGPCTTQVCGAGSATCLAPINIDTLGAYDIPIDTCATTDNFTFPAGACSPSATPPAGTPDVVLRGATPGNYSLSVDPSFTIGILDPSGSCATYLNSCGSGTYGQFGGAPGNVYFGVERTVGGCGRTTIHIVHS